MNNMCGNKKIDLFELSNNLDEEQCEAVFSQDKNILCRSIAGSGKTRVITYRVAYLMAKNISEKNILLLTFTNKASKEMIDRVQTILGKDKLDILAGTFHHVALIFLRKYAQVLGYKNNFTILTPSDAKDLISKIKDEKKKIYKFKNSDIPNKKVIFSIYSKAMNYDEDIDNFVYNYLSNNYNYETIEIVKLIINEYIQRKKDGNLMDFDDIIDNFRVLLKKESIRNKINNQYHHIIIDEYQDINSVQFEIIQMLCCGQKNNLFAVGDENQSIYGWRGGKVSYIENFKEYFPNSKVFSIQTNYRSEGYVLKFAENSINNNYTFCDNKVKMNPVKPYVNKPIFDSGCYDECEQAEYICQSIINKRKQGVELKEIAILVRYNFQTPIIEKMLRKYKIPYKMFAGKSFFDRKHINDVLSFLKLFSNPKDEIALYRALKLFDGIGTAFAGKIFNYLKESNYDLDRLEIDSIKKVVKTGAKSLEGYTQFLNILNKMKNSNEIFEKIRVLLNLFYEKYLINNEDDYKDRLMDLEYLIKNSKEYNSLDEFLSDMVIEEVSDEKETENQQKDAIILTSIHKSKGLEYDCVFLPYLNERVFPKESNELEDIEEERRVFYVAVTRAKKFLYMSSVYKISNNSEFIQEVSTELYEVV